MKGLLKVLAAAKLIELSPDEQAYSDQSSLNTEQRDTSQATTPSNNTSFEDKITPNLIAESTIATAPISNLSDIYQKAQLPVAIYPAERFLKLLEGLQAMDITTRKAAVMAMDAADDSWTINDILVDAERKSAALAEYQQGLNIYIQQASANTTELIHKSKAIRDETAATINSQIADLQALLQRNSEKTATEISTLENELNTMTQQTNSEIEKATAEMARLQSIQALFQSSNSDTNASETQLK